jgi:hypothetical protein
MDESGYQSIFYLFVLLSFFLQLFKESIKYVDSPPANPAKVKFIGPPYTLQKSFNCSSIDNGSTTDIVKFADAILCPFVLCCTNPILVN